MTINLQILTGDEPEESLTIGVWLPVSLNTAALFSRECYSPEELWTLLHCLAEDPETTYKEAFDYPGFTKPSPKNISLDSLDLGPDLSSILDNLDLSLF